MPAKITVCYPEQPAVESFLFEENGYRIGRSHECELFLDHPTVSRQHAKVAHLNQRWQLHDEHSRNGTRVNGIAITHSSLAEDALISLGQLDCLFETKSFEQVDAINNHNVWRRNQCQQQISTQMSQHFSQNLNTQLQNIILLTGMQRGMVLLGNCLDDLQISMSIGMQSDDFKLARFQGSVGAISQCIRTERSVFAMDVSHHQLWQARKSIELKQIAAFACIPLFYKDKIIGIIYTDSKMSDKILTELDVEILNTMSQQLEATVQALLLQHSIDLLQTQLHKEVIRTSNIANKHLLTMCH